MGLGLGTRARANILSMLINYLRPIARTYTKNYRNIIRNFIHVDSYRILVNYVTLFLLSSYNVCVCVCVCVCRTRTCAQNSTRSYAARHRVMGVRCTTLFITMTIYTDRSTLSECVCASVLYLVVYCRSNRSG